MKKNASVQKLNKVKKEKISLSLQKKLLFAGITFILLFIFILMLEAGLRIFDYGDDLRLFVSTPTEDSPYYGMNLKVAQRYFYYYGDAFDPTPRKDLFLKQKPQNGFRIFVLGASTTAGFPYSNNISFPRFLQQRLADSFPDRHIEVINTAITSVNTYTLLDFMDEILEQKPNLILVYAGHNEFFGPFGPVSGVAFGKYPWVVRTVLYLQQYKTFILLRNIFGPLVRKWNQEISLDPARGATKEINDDFIKHTQAEYDGELFKNGLDQYETNLKGILEKAQDANVPVILSELVCNVHDQRPFPTKKQESASMAEKTFSEAIKTEKDGNLDLARKLYYKAKDLDPVRFRAPEAFNLILHQLAKDFNTPIVPMKSIFEKVSPHGIIGNNIILEHVHPNISGYFLMSEAFYAEMRRHNLIEKTWPITNPQTAVTYLQNWGITRLDTLAAQLVTLNLTSGWPFTTESFSTKLAKESIINNFPVKTIVDSLALKTYINPDYSVQSAHYDLAKYFEKKGEYGHALREYQALICSIPAMDIFYEDAVHILLKIKQYERAKLLLLNALKYTQSVNIYKWLGKTCLALNQLRKAINNFNIVLKSHPDDNQTAFNLIQTYYNMGLFKKGDNILIQYENRADSDKIFELKKYRQSTQEQIQKASQFFEIARENFERKNYNKAIEALQQSVKVHESSVANELMGVIMLRGNQHDFAVMYLERARSLSINDNPNLLSNLVVAYSSSNQLSKASDTLHELQVSFPDFKGNAYVERLLSGVIAK